MIRHSELECSDGAATMLLPPVGSADYDCDSFLETGYSADLNGDGLTTKLKGSDEWNILNFPLPCMLEGEFFFGSNEPPILDQDEHTDEEAKADGVYYAPAAPPVHVEPGCSVTRVPEDRDGQIRLAVLWSSELDPQDIDPATARLAGALALGYADVHANADTDLDRLFVFDAGDMTLSAASDTLPFYAKGPDGRLVLTRDPFTWTPAFTDTDGDGVRDLCDSCPTSAATAPDLDGCP